ncbi:MAG: hypothetical protein N2317_08200 [Syntrophales bacterium]|nr:hypothetical protein [Syntrophales bacterium]
MAEIKSTLELIMEKTKGMTITPEERINMKRKELEGKGRGILQGYIDGRLSDRDVHAEMEKWDRDILDPDIFLIGEALDRIKPDSEENVRIFEFLEKVLGANVDPLKDVLREFNRTREREMMEWSQSYMQRLALKGIRGSAVMPNPDYDPLWKEREKLISERFSSRLCEIKRRLTRV